MLTYTARLSALLASSVLLVAGGARLTAAPVTITSSVTAAGSNYQYNFTITNNSSTDPDAELISVDFPSLPAGSVVGEALAPYGYGEVTTGDYILFDTVNTPSFAPGTAASGFSLVDSMSLPSISFEALYFNSGETQTDVVTGSVSPQAGAATPEPGTWGLLAGASLFLLGGYRRLRTISSER